MGRLCFRTGSRLSPEEKYSPVRNGALFAVMVQILLSITSVAPAPLMRSNSGGTSLVAAANLSPVTKLVAGTGAVSRYKLDRS